MSKRLEIPGMTTFTEASLRYLFSNTHFEIAPLRRIYKALTGTSPTMYPPAEWYQLSNVQYNQGRKSDFDSWTMIGNHGWSLDDLLPYIKKHESFEDPANMHPRTTSYSSSRTTRLFMVMMDLFIPVSAHGGDIGTSLDRSF